MDMSKETPTELEPELSPEAKPQIVRVQYYSETTGELSPRPYTYYSADRLSVGDIVIVPVRDTTGKAKVSQVDVPEAEIAAFKDKVKTIPVGAVQCVPTAEGVAELLGESSPIPGCLPDNLPELEEKADRAIGVSRSSQPETVTRTDIFIAEYDKLAEESTYLNEPDTETAVALRPGEDIEVRGHYDTAVSLLKYATKLTITTLEESELAVSDLASISTCKKAMEAKRKEKLAPSKKESEDINATYKELMAPVLEAEEILKHKQLIFLNEQRRIQAEQERINQQRLEAAQAEMKLTGELSESLVEIEVVNAPKSVHGAIGSSGMVDHWTYEIVDRDIIPREYMIEDTVLLGNTAKKYHDQKPVPGIKFVNKPYLATRTK
uniref:Uncharacterized protein n=1 Tax=viral metagenome TaxID=1070528 RepID=A0A6M3LHR1_9ZZZZ